MAELASWLRQYNVDSDCRAIALKVFFTLPSLLLQKPSKSSKAKDHLAKLVERLKMWQEGKLSELLCDARLIQKRLTTGKKRQPEDTARVFPRLMFQGKINAALKFLSEESEKGVHELNDDVLRKLCKQHPEASPIKDNTLLFGPIEEISSSYFDSIDEGMIANAARLTKGSGGPSQLDGEHFRHLVLCNKFKKESRDLRVEIATFAKKIATTIIDPSTIKSLIACRLIPLNKGPDPIDNSPGVRPIGVGEILRRVIGKAIGWVLKPDIQQSAGPLQSATGLKGGSEAAIHAMREIFQDDDTEAVILVDARNAFNAMNRQAALHNMQVICPAFGTVLINTYREPTRLIISGGKEILSKEGTTQGDNLAMPFYGLGMTFVQTSIRFTKTHVKQVWLADDATGGGTLVNLKVWWDLMIESGSRMGYYVNESKSWLILKDSNKLEEAKRIFNATSIQYTTEGKRHLGATIGSDDFRTAYATQKVTEWCDELERLSTFAKSQPQAAFAAFIHGEQHRFNFFLRTIPGMHLLMEPLDRIIDDKLLPALFDGPVSPSERELFSLPIREGGLGIPVFSEKGLFDYEASTIITAPLAAVMMLQGDTLPDEIVVKEARSNAENKSKQALVSKVERVGQSLSPTSARAVEHAKQPGASSWLSVIPLEEQGFVLTKGEFRDALALRYSKDLRGLPSKCPCGEKFDLNHALNCKRGGYIIMRHNNVRDFEANLLRRVHTDVETEPPLQPLGPETVNGLSGDEARPDIRARGVWRPGQNAYFDIRITNTNSASHVHQPPEKILIKYERHKKRDYNNRIMNIEHGTFTPLVFSVSGSAGPECSTFHRHIAEKIAAKSGERFDKILGWIRCKLSFTILRACLMCVRGSRGFGSSRGADVVEDFDLACLDARLD